MCRGSLLAAWSMVGLCFVPPATSMASAERLVLEAPAASAAEPGDEWDDFEEAETVEPQAGALPFSLHGFLSAAAASRIVKDPTSADDYLLVESRGRVELGAEVGRARGRLKVDFLADPVDGGVSVDFREGWADFTTDALSLRVGRQILTWGTGDFVFLNDLFPKDFQAFFIGRDDEFLKAPADALRLGVHLGSLGLDLVWTPVFAADRFVSGERLSFFFLPAGERVGPSTEVTPLRRERPDLDLENGEWAARLYGASWGWEFAAYGYLGFFKSPVSFDPASEVLFHSRLGVYGLSARGQIFGGVFNLETAFYHSWDDARGTDPFVPNHQVRGLLGYEFEPLPRLIVGLQYYLEATLNHDALVANSPAAAFEPEAVRHLSTLRLTYRALLDRLETSLFVFYSPSDQDAHLRPRVGYKVTDSIQLVVGALISLGKRDFTFFGQLERNTSVYGRARFSF